MLNFRHKICYCIVVMKYEIKVIRSKRRSLSLEVKNDGGIVVRAPLKLKEKEIERFVKSKEKWLEKQLKKAEENSRIIENTEKLSEAETAELNERARAYLTERVKIYSEMLSVSYNKISVKPLRSKWGSCSRDGNLSFNSLLMLTPPEVIDAIVVHELCHRLKMNHSKAFYANVLSVYPDYGKYNKWLKDNGRLIIARLPEKTK